MTFDFNQQRTLTVDLDGEEQDVEVTVHYSVGRAEPDVGIMSAFVDDMYLEDEHGNRATAIEKALSKDEWEDLTVRVMEDHEPDQREYERE